MSNIIYYSQVDIVLHQSHAGIAGPALLVVIAHYVLIVGIWVLRQVPLNQIPGLISREPGGSTEKPRLVLIDKKTFHSGLAVKVEAIH